MHALLCIEAHCAFFCSNILSLCGAHARPGCRAALCSSLDPAGAEAHLVAQELQAVAADKAALQEAASAASAAHEAETGRLRAELAAQRVWLLQTLWHASLRRVTDGRSRQSGP